MKLQNLCHFRSLLVISALFGFSAVADDAGRGDPPGAATPGVAPAAAATAVAAAPTHDYPTIARVEFVDDCVARNGGKLAAVYQCACAIDRIADALTYDDYVEASTYAHYATLPGQAGSIFRDSDAARKMAKSYRELEAGALKSCGMTR